MGSGETTSPLVLDQTNRAGEQRDGLTAIILGGFIALLSLLVLAGVGFASASIDRLINLAAGMVLLAVGLAFVWSGRRHLRRSRASQARRSADSGDGKFGDSTSGDSTSGDSISGRGTS